CPQLHSPSTSSARPRAPAPHPSADGSPGPTLRNRRPTGYPRCAPCQRAQARDGSRCPRAGWDDAGMHDDADTRAYSLDDLGRAIRECAEHLADQPWGGRPQMFALVPTALLAEQDPSLLHALDDAGLTVVEQEPLHEDLDQHPEALEEIVAGTRWP